MPSVKHSPPSLKPMPPSPWLKKAINGIEYWVYILTGLCGINIRGLAKLCGVDHSTIREIIRNAKKAKGEVGGLRETELYNLLKNKDIFLEKVGGLSPIQQGGPVKIIVLEVCLIFISYFILRSHF
ncbi:hypothetical protein TI05_10455 [Achromatium sp. WMS3]|nr:hypothetical protein TI05_10455 [Achromatium sp. WMS3]